MALEALSAVQTRAWLTFEKHLRTIRAVAARDITPEMRDEAKRVSERRKASIAALASRDSAKLSGTDNVYVRDGVAIIPVMGTIFQFSNLFTDYSGGVSLELLQKDFVAAVENPEVKAILLWMDSPGGEAQGIAEFGDIVFAAREVKPVVTYIDAMCASGAYWIASQTERIYGDRLSMSGSIGAIAYFMVDKEALAMAGLEEVIVKSNVSPKKAPEPDDPEGLAQIQTWVNDIGAEFVAAAARGREASKQDVVEKYGAGDMMVGRRAVRAGLIDGIASFEGTLKALAAGKVRTRAKVKAGEQGLDPHVESSTLNESGATDDRRKETLMGEETEGLTAEEQSTFTKLLAKLGLQRLDASDKSAGVQTVDKNSPFRAAALAAHRTAASAFVGQMRSQGRIKPPLVRGFEALYMICAEADLDSPAKIMFKMGAGDGQEDEREGSRLDVFKAVVEALPKSQATAEFIDPKALVKKGAQVLTDEEGEDPGPLGDIEASVEAFATSSGTRRRERPNGNGRGQ